MVSRRVFDAQPITWAILAYVSLFFVVPWCALSHFRYRLWALRDGLWDAIHTGHFDNRDQPQKLVAEMEMVIRAAREVSPLRMVLLVSCFQGQKLPPHPMSFDLQAVEGSDKKRLAEYVEAFELLIARHALKGTVSGWLFSAVGVPFFLLRELLKRGPRTRPPRSLLVEAKHHTRDELVQFESALAILKQRTREKRGAVSARA